MPSYCGGCGADNWKTLTRGWELGVGYGLLAVIWSLLTKRKKSYAKAVGTSSVHLVSRASGLMAR